MSQSIRHVVFRAAGCLTLAGASFAADPSPTAWLQPLQPSGLQDGARFGAAVATDGQRVIVGAPGVSQGKGKFFAYDLVNGSWAYTMGGAPLGLEAGDEFGAAIAFDGDLVFVGAPGDDDRGVDAGAVYVCYPSAGLGIYLIAQKLYGTDTAAGDRFGAAIDEHSGLLAIGAPGATVALPNDGAAYLFEHDGVQWVETAWFVPPQPQPGAQFGAAVTVSKDAVKGTYFGVGAPGTDVVVDSPPVWTNSGKAYLFRDGTKGNPAAGWTFIDEFVNSVPNYDNRLGASVDLEGDRMMVGAPGGNSGGNPGAAYGAAYVAQFKSSFPTEDWSLKYIFSAPNPKAQDQIGLGVAIDGASVYFAGSTRVLHREFEDGVATVMPELTPPFADLYDGNPSVLGPAVTARGDLVVVGRPGSGNDKGSAVVFAAHAGAWTVTGSGTQGTTGEPRLRGAGTLIAGTALELRLNYGFPSAPALFLLKIGTAGATPFHGGSLYAFPYNLALPMTLSSVGTLVLPATMPSSVSNWPFVLQFAIADPNGAGGVSLSNGLSVLTAP